VKDVPFQILVGYSGAQYEVTSFPTKRERPSGYAAELNLIPNCDIGQNPTKKLRLLKTNPGAVLV
jgi:hypothetical protein